MPSFEQNVSEAGSSAESYCEDYEGGIGSDGGVNVVLEVKVVQILVDEPEGEE